MEIRQLPALRVLIIFIICYTLLINFSFGLTVTILSLFFVFATFQISSIKNSLILFGIVLICCARINLKSNVFLPPDCYKIERVVKANKEKIIFIAKGKKKVLFTLKIQENKPFVYYMNDIIEYSQELMPLPNPKNLNGFVYADYLKKIGVDSVAYPNRYPKLIFRDSLSVIVLALNFRQSIISYLLSFSEVTKPTKGFLVALLTGDKSYLEKTDYQLFRESGIIHVLAISGLHIGILYLTLYFLFSKFLRLNSKLVFFLISLILISYAFTTGLSPSVIRAVLMFILINFGKSFQKSSSTLNIVFLSAILMLFFQPELLLDVGFQLSYSAVIGIVLVMQYTNLKSWIQINYLSVFWKVFLVNTSAFIFTTPLIIFHFGVVNFTSVWASFLVVPLIMICMYLGILILLLSFYSYFATKAFLILDYLFYGLSGLLNLITQYLKVSFNFVLSIEGLVVSFFTLICLVTRRVNWIIFSLCLCVFILFLPRSEKIQFLKLTPQVQVKYKGEIFYVRKGDSIMIEDIRLSYKNLNKLYLKKNDSIITVDFNVNNYKFLDVGF